MTIERIDRADDPRIAAYRDVRDGLLVRTRGLFVAEGRLIVRRVIEDKRYRVQSLLVNDAALHDLAPAIATIEPYVPIFACNADELTGIAGYHVHRGCLALVERPPATLMEDVLASSGTIVALEGVSNADNVGGVFRNAAAFGAGGVLLSPTCCDPLYRKAIRTSMGAVLRVPFARAADGDWPGALARIRAAGFTLVALTPREPSETLDAFAARAHASRIALVVGTEGTGLTPAVEAAADERVRIPISDRVDSLNLAVAVGIALHALRAGGRDGVPAVGTAVGTA
jgi:tRNA G18 (ribose-2'-O)-methylase SpoU